MTQQEMLNKLQGYAKFELGGNNNYIAKKDGATITIYTNGNFQVQGKKDYKDKIEQDIRTLLEQESISNSDKQLFIVYGHDKIAKEQLENILEKLDIQTNQWLFLLNISYCICFHVYIFQCWDICKQNTFTRRISF